MPCAGCWLLRLPASAVTPALLCSRREAAWLQGGSASLHGGWSRLQLHPCSVHWAAAAGQSWHPASQLQALQAPAVVQAQAFALRLLPRWGCFAVHHPGPVCSCCQAAGRQLSALLWRAGLV